MVIEEYGFWQKLTEKDKGSLITQLFNEYVVVLSPLLTGCEKAFVNNFIVSLSSRKYFAGEIIQRGML